MDTTDCTRRQRPARSRVIQRVRSTFIACLLATGMGTLSLGAQAQTNEYELAAMKAQYLRPKAVPFPKNNPFSAAKLDLGRQLFFDTRLSGSGTMSCASCHNPSLAWGDGKPVGIGWSGNHLGRRSPTILNLAWAEMLFWCFGERSPHFSRR